MKKTFIITKEVNVPIVSSQVAHRPAQVKFRKFRKGQLVQGELKHANNKPSFVLVGRMCVIPVECVKEIQGKEVSSNVTGQELSQKLQTQQVTANKKVAPSNTKVKYLDALLIGGLVGFGGVYFAEKKGWLQGEDNKMKMYGAITGAILGMYYVYRSQNTATKKVVVNQNIQ